MFGPCCPNHESTARIPATAENSGGGLVQFLFFLPRPKFVLYSSIGYMRSLKYSGQNKLTREKKRARISPNFARILPEFCPNLARFLPEFSHWQNVRGHNALLPRVPHAYARARHEIGLCGLIISGSGRGRRQ